MAQANQVENEEIIATIIEANLVCNVAKWVLDTGVTRHIYANKGLFQEFKEAIDGNIVYM